jgi:hypothetical protein
VSNDWLIAELLWYWLNWYRRDKEGRPIHEWLIDEERWANAVARLHSMTVETPHFSLEEIRLEANDRRNFHHGNKLIDDE